MQPVTKREPAGSKEFREWHRHRPTWVPVLLRPWWSDVRDPRGHIAVDGRQLHSLAVTATCCRPRNLLLSGLSCRREEGAPEKPVQLSWAPVDAHQGAQLWPDAVCRIGATRPDGGGPCEPQRRLPCSLSRRAILLMIGDECGERNFCGDCRRSDGYYCYNRSVQLKKNNNIRCISEYNNEELFGTVPYVQRAVPFDGRLQLCCIRARGCEMSFF